MTTVQVVRDKTTGRFRRVVGEEVDEKEQIQVGDTITLPQRMGEASLSEDGTIHRLVQITRNGRAYELSRFASHSLLVRYFYRDYERKDGRAFITHMREYLRQALYLIPQAGTEEEHRALLEHLSALIEYHGAYPVIRQLLSGLNGI